MSEGRLLTELLGGLVDEPALAAVRDIRVSAICEDSRRVTPGALFFALRGVGADGRRFVADAVARGAAAVVGEGLDASERSALISTPDARRMLAHVAARWHGLDAGPPLLLGVTGTNGKSTTAIMVRSIAQAAGHKCALIGTVYYDLCSRVVAAEMTTPGPLQLAEYLRTARDAGAAFAAMEVSSHALDQRRTDGLTFRAAAFTNLTGDHLDYHGTFENYRDAKARLFEQLPASAAAVVNCDDAHHEHMIRATAARVLKFSLRGPADLSATIARESIGGTTYRLRIGDTELVLENAVVGRHNVYNALTAAGLAWGAGLPLEAIARGLRAVRNVPGRLQRVPVGLPADVFVDYAHTDDALLNVLAVLKPLTRRRLIVVFGCGGDRDKTKRPRMAQAVGRFADGILVTSDNPRTEDPDAIIREILAGFDAATRRRVCVEPDRRAAIHAALAGAREGDVVLIAGKGHENYQIVGTEKLPFDDVAVAIAAGASLAGAPA
ncbi:MAG: UDP-N-acetylmuramoyl-L-alanyl-D-glutamate--2,6-diaminopimelate ligase [Phycisphaerae bacterium]